MKQVLKAALPHHAAFIDQHGFSGAHWLLEELEEKLLTELLTELKEMLEGRDADEESIKRSADIMEKVKQLDKGRAEVANAVQTE